MTRLDILERYAASVEAGIQDDKWLTVGLVVAKLPLLEGWVKAYRMGEYDVCEKLAARQLFKNQLAEMITKTCDRIEGGEPPRLPNVVVLVAANLTALGVWHIVERAMIGNGHADKVAEFNRDAMDIGALRAARRWVRIFKEVP